MIHEPHSLLFLPTTASEAGDIRSDDEDDNNKQLKAREMGHEPRNGEGETKESGSESNSSISIGGDQRMSLSSLPGVRATTGISHRRSGRRPSKMTEPIEGSQKKD